MRGGLRTFCEERITRLGQRSVFDGDALHALWSAFLAGQRTVHWSHLWYLVVLEDWMERNGIE